MKVGRIVLAVSVTALAAGVVALNLLIARPMDDLLAGADGWLMLCAIVLLLAATGIVWSAARLLRKAPLPPALPPPPPPLAPPPDGDSAKLDALARAVIAAGHDLRGRLSPALLLADSLAAHPDPKVRDTAEKLASGIEDCAAVLTPAVKLAKQAGK